jgi:hypothetical protein
MAVPIEKMHGETLNRRASPMPEKQQMSPALI